VSGLENPVLSGGQYYVKPTNTGTHQKYTFYTKITANGGSSDYFGPYYLDVGCTSTSVTFSNSGSFDTTANTKYVADSTSVTYTMHNPSTGRAYCSVTSNVVVESDGSTDSTKMNEGGCGSQPCTSGFRMINTNERLSPYTFKIKTTITGGLTHASPSATITIRCDDYQRYSVSLSSWPSSLSGTQYVQHGSADVGFTVGNYVTNYNTGCPVETYGISWSNYGGTSGVNQPSELASSVATVGGNNVFKVQSTAYHRTFYPLYIKASAKHDVGSHGSNTWTGPYRLNVGCFTGTGGLSTYDASDSSYTNTQLSIGVTVTDAFIF
jgi:hypothetical protein